MKVEFRVLQQKELIQLFKILALQFFLWGEKEKQNRTLI